MNIYYKKVIIRSLDLKNEKKATHPLRTKIFNVYLLLASSFSAGDPLKNTSLMTLFA